ncbi:MAG: hypothetical protein WD342_06880 [Verrucomicrobiales bacterium]
MESPAAQLNPPDRSTLESPASARPSQCEISDADIAEMICLFDSGMVDLTTADAVVVSLSGVAETASLQMK